jgi:hypothetical protein
MEVGSRASLLKICRILRLERFAVYNDRLHKVQIQDNGTLAIFGSKYFVDSRLFKVQDTVLAKKVMLFQSGPVQKFDATEQ